MFKFSTPLISDNFAIFAFFKPLRNILLALPLFFVFPGCASYKYPTERLTCEQKRPDTGKHWLYSIVPRHRCQIQWYDLGHWTTWAIFGNDDDGIFGESPDKPYKPGCRNTLSKALSWWARNPFHNFTHYTIGSAQRVNSEITLFNFNCHGVCCCCYKAAATHNYGCKCTSLYAALHGGKPFLSLRICYPWRRKTEFYFGWRKQGNFGLKFLPMVDEKKHKACFSAENNCRHK